MGDFSWFMVDDFVATGFALGKSKAQEAPPPLGFRPLSRGPMFWVKIRSFCLGKCLRMAWLVGLVENGSGHKGVNYGFEGLGQGTKVERRVTELW